MESEGTVRLARAFCSARDRNVPVLRREHVARGEEREASGSAASQSEPGGTEDRHVPDAATSDEVPEFVACLDYGVRCTGWLCPLFTLPTLPPEDLLAEAVEAERTRKEQSVADGRAILERAVREGVSHRERAARQTTGRARSPDQGADVPESDSPSDPPPAP